jgi:sirohydrochlorin ferrochelatase
MNGPTLLAVAHGSKHPAATATIRALAGEVERLAPVLDIQVAFVQDAEPKLSDALDAAGPDVVIVPLLLSTGYHLTNDIAGAATAMDTAITTGATVAPRVAGPLGPDPLLVTALTGRLAEAGVPGNAPVVLAAAGSSVPDAADQVQAQADLLAAERGAPVSVGYAAADQPTVADAVSDLRAQTGSPVAVASYLLAPGHFHDRLSDSGANWVTAPLGAHPAIAALVIDRYRTHRTAAGRAA